jgi:hypothetical protein
MKLLSTLAFGAFALTTAIFTTVAPAAAGNVGVYAGSDGFAIQVNHYDRDYRRACRDYWYRRHHPYECGYSYPGYYGHRYDNDDWRWRFRNRHRDRDWDDRRGHDRDRDHDRRRDRDRDHDRHDRRGW